MDMDITREGFLVLLSQMIVFTWNMRIWMAKNDSAYGNVCVTPGGNSFVVTETGGEKYQTLFAYAELILHA